MAYAWDPIPKHSLLFYLPVTQGARKEGDKTFNLSRQRKWKTGLPPSDGTIKGNGPLNPTFHSPN
jgi:hypothetical protein